MDVAERRAAIQHEAMRLLEERDTRLAEDHLHDFIRQAWPLVEPDHPFQDNWHIGAMCEHLEAVSVHKQIKNLLINVPPGTSKSLTVSVFFPAWLWVKRASYRFMCASFDQALSTRDNWRMRQVVENEWYGHRWPHVQMSEDQNQKLRFNTTAGGWRIGTSFGGRVVGEHPDGKIIDDPHNTKTQVLTDNDIKRATDFYQFGLKPRGGMIGAWTVLLMQRLHQSDLSGFVLASEQGQWHHLCLPMRWEKRDYVVMPGIDWKDPRTDNPGALLWPVAWTEEKCNSTFKPGTWGDAGQFQQRPAPSGGLMFKRAWFQFVDKLPTDVEATVRFWDVAGTEEGDGARTAGVKMLRTTSGLFIITDVVVDRWGEAQVDQTIKQTARLDGTEVRVREEQEPGSAGKAIVRRRKREMAGWNYYGVPSTGDKVTRARPFAAQADPGTTASGNVRLFVPANPDGTPGLPPPWVQEFLDEIELFPAGALKDQVDAAAGAFNVLTGVAGELSISTGADKELTEEEQKAQEEAAKKRAAEAVVAEINRSGAYFPTHSGGLR